MKEVDERAFDHICMEKASYKFLIINYYYVRRITCNVKKKNGLLNKTKFA